MRYCRVKSKVSDNPRLNSYLYATPNLIERLTQGEGMSRKVYETKAVMAIAAFDQAFVVR
jgi:hypothetical protein